MQSYQEIINEVYHNHELWLYKDGPNPIDLDIENPIDCRHFIEGYFEAAKKAYGNLLLKDLQKIEDRRCIHIVYTFLLGICIYNNSNFIKTKLDKEFHRYEDALINHKQKFAFVWFLICLFHDLGYAVEDKKVTKQQYNSYDKLINAVGVDIFDELVGVPSLYRGHIGQYFNYKLNHPRFRNCDHGIVAGHFLYHDLYEIRRRESQDRDCKYWKEGLIGVYKFAASIVLCHNIFYSFPEDDNDTIQKYQDSGMGDMIRTGCSREIKVSKFPTYFLFSLVDNLDISKREGWNMDNLKIIISNKEMKLDIASYDDKIRERVEKQMKSMDSWLTDVKEREGCIVISLNNG